MAETAREPSTEAVEIARKFLDCVPTAAWPMARLLDTFAEAAVAAERARATEEIEWLRRLVGWCRPRLKNGPYPVTLDLKLAAGPHPKPEDERVVQSAEAIERGEEAT